MSKVYTHMTMSLDGFVADPQDGVGELFGWYDAGSVHLPSADERWSFDVDEGSAGLLGEILSSTGALCAAADCSTTRVAGATVTRSALRWSWSPITPPMAPTHGSGPRSWTASRRGSLERQRSPARRTSA